jgi:hypothetical protein
MAMERTDDRLHLDRCDDFVTMGSMIALLARTMEFLFYHLLLAIVDRVSRLPRNTMMPEAMRLYRENIALKAQLDALLGHFSRLEKRAAPVPIRTRAAQVFAYYLTRGNEPFQRYFLSASVRTIRRWATRSTFYVGAPRLVAGHRLTTGWPISS